MAGLVLWSFLMATAHGTGMMLVPALVPLGMMAGPGMMLSVGDSLVLSLAAVALHTTTMLAATGTIAVVVYEWVGVGFLRRAWINLDLIWTAALVITGIILVLV